MAKRTGPKRSNVPTTRRGKPTKRQATRATKAGAERGGSKTAREKLLARLRRYIRAKGAAFLQDENISSLGIGYKIRNGERTEELCIQFTVGSKAKEGTGLEGLGSAPIPETLEIDGERIPTDVIERKFGLSYRTVGVEETGSRKKRVDPVAPGVSVCHRTGTAGTLGLVVFDRQRGDPCMLSNWHVLHRSSGKIGDGIVQPGPHDDNNVDLNHAGTLVRSHLGVAGDCAIARIEDREFRRDILELDVTPTRIAAVDLDDVVFKSGRTTGVTEGVVRRTDVMTTINYPGVGDREIGGFEIGPPAGASSSFEVSMGGDSGAAWVVAMEDGTPSDVLVGLHFAGESSATPTSTRWPATRTQSSRSSTSR